MLSGITDKTYFPDGSDFTGLNGRRIPKKDYEALAPFKFFCKECSFKSKRESHFAKHIKLHEKASDLFQCKRCDFTSIRLSHLRRHEVLHSQTLLRCQQCKYNTDSSKLLARHVKNKHSTQQKQHTVIYTCAKCQYKTLRRHLYNSHLRISHNQVIDAETIGNSISKLNKTYQCDLCAYKTQRKEHYVRHQNNVHCNRRPYLCDLCGKAFKRPDALAQHKYTHMDKSARVLPFTCTLCAKAFRSQVGINLFYSDSDCLVKKLSFVFFKFFYMILKDTVLYFLKIHFLVFMKFSQNQYFSLKLFFFIYHTINHIKCLEYL